MIDHRPYAALGGHDLGWLQARLHVAIGGMGRPEHGAIGPLRAWNDDTFAPHTGFGMHGHRDVEIVTYVRQGAVTHEDSLGNRTTVAAGDVQAMRAGSGIRHSERNDGDVPLLLYQIWLRPRTTGGAPSWSTRRFPSAERAGALAVLASGDARDVDALPIDADARLLGATLRAGDVIEHRLPPGHGAYLVTTAGRVTINGVTLAARDGIGVVDEAVVTIAALEDTEIVLAELLQD
ncbi:pirin [Massilia sp. JS1662]|nr:pirin family protein [Massilia sp. JS1662]KGF81426.1 pirin [Massilia sp. JS1662]